MTPSVHLEELLLLIQLDAKLGEKLNIHSKSVIKLLT